MRYKLTPKLVINEALTEPYAHDDLYEAPTLEEGLQWLATEHGVDAQRLDALRERAAFCRRDVARNLRRAKSSRGNTLAAIDPQTKKVFLGAFPIPDGLERMTDDDIDVWIENYFGIRPDRR
ncbi:MAG: hypothetical protein WCK14_12365 [Actinomycetota bacterium]|jgi:hypothetical protein